MKELLSGNEAIARGAFNSGVTVAAAYPGTPSTEILENFARYPGIYAEWSPNEKVALEVGIGASLAGARTLVTMKHVGVNVAADPLMTLAYTGVNGGLVLVSADDPSMHSSQNEQDNRFYARFAKIPMLEPADSQEALDMVGLALELSERFDLPVMLRTTTRISHSRSLVEPGEARPFSRRQYQKDEKKYLMIPAFARLRQMALTERLAGLKEYAENCPVNVIEWRDRSVGVVTSGVAYQYVREVLPHMSVLKLGLTHPLPERLVNEFAAGVERLFVVEELEPFLEEQLRALGLEVTGKSLIPATGELDAGIVARGMARAGVIDNVPREVTLPEAPPIPARPPVMCSGCPHRGIFYVLRRLKLVVSGDIGCYTLGGLAPLAAMDTCICMGASIGIAHGAAKADPEMAGRTVAVIGDSTFMHSGLTGLLNVVYNKGVSTVLIPDNHTTAMTGRQHHPGTGSTLLGQEVPEVDMPALVRALGVKRVRVIDPLDLAETTAALREESAAAEPSVIIARRPCVLLGGPREPAVKVRPGRCTGCKACLRLGCPSLSIQGQTVRVDAVSCNGCGLCLQVCGEEALEKGVENRA